MKFKGSQYLMTLDEIEEAYFELDLAGYFTFFNKATIDMTGYSRIELQHMSPRKYLPKKDIGRIWNIFNEVYRTGNPAEIFDIKLIRKDGSKRFREVSASLIRDSSGYPIGFRCLARDVTKRRLAELALQKREKTLAQQNAALKELNTTLKVLVKKWNEEKIAIERTMSSNIHKTLIPYVEKLKRSQLTNSQRVIIDMIETNLRNIASPFFDNITLKEYNLTLREFQVADLIKGDKTTKEIADFLHVSNKTIDYHRNNIRKKLGITNTRKSLMCMLKSKSR